jgi:hypothetical protein
MHESEKDRYLKKGWADFNLQSRLSIKVSPTHSVSKDWDLLIFFEMLNGQQ